MMKPTGGGAALQVQGRNPGRMRHRRHHAEHPGLSLLLQGRAGLEHLPRAEERRREGRADVFRLLERMVARSVAADRGGAADGGQAHRRRHSTCMYFRPGRPSRRALNNRPDRGGPARPPRHAQRERSMSTFDDPFDADRNRRGPAASAASIAPRPNTSTRRRRCAASRSQSEEKRYEGVVASAVMRAMFPKDAARRAFLKSVGASTALAAISQFFPLQTATEVFAQARRAREEGSQGRLHPDHLRDADHHGRAARLLCKHGLNVEVVKTAGWAVVRDKTINKEYDAAHMLAPMPIAISLGLGSNRSRSRCRRSRTSTGRASRSR